MSKPIQKAIQKHLSALVLIFSVTLLSSFTIDAKAADYPELNVDQLEWLGQQIYNNECNQQASCLTSWNVGENFPSLGLGHFIWFQSAQEEIFVESFPQLLLYLQSQSIQIPHWIIEENFNSPWLTREGFLADLDKARLTELRNFLLQNMTLQTQFIVQRFEQALSIINNESSSEDKATLEKRFLEVANASPPYGLYALIDYVNFKGEGVALSEQYMNQGWGLKQVLKNMEPTQTSPLQEFVISAQRTLELRVQNSPIDRNEQRWLRGWHNRLQTYLPNTLAKDTLLKAQD